MTAAIGAVAALDRQAGERELRVHAGGGAQVLADTLIARFGEDRAPFALGVASLLFGFPIFFDAGLVVMLPIIFSVARRFGGSVLRYALPAAGAFAVMHAFVPPHPGPVAAADLVSADIGLLLIFGLLIGLPTWYLASYFYGLWAGSRFMVDVPDLLSGGHVPEAKGDDARRPSFGLVLAVLLLPMVLIFVDTGLNTLATQGVIDGDATWVAALRIIGKTPIALLITTLFAMVVLGWRRRSMADVETIMNDALAPVCAIILITGAGGMFGGVLRASGIGQAAAERLATLGIRRVGSDAGMHTLMRPALYDAWHGIHNLTRLDDADDVAVEVVGPICESSDVFGTRRRLPAATREGDTVLIADAGAYGFVMANTYNLRGLPREDVIE